MNTAHIDPALLHRLVAVTERNLDTIARTRHQVGESITAAEQTEQEFLEQQAGVWYLEGLGWRPLCVACGSREDAVSDNGKCNVCEYKSA